MLTIHQYLSNDHARLDALLAQAIASADHIDDVAYRELRLGLLRHIAMEEKVLFAYVRAQHDDSVEHVIKILHDDHAAIASLLVPPPTHALIATLQRVLDEHNPLEDGPGGFYDHCDRAAPDPQALIARMDAIPAVRASQYLDEPRIYAHIERMLAARDRSKHVRDDDE